MRIKKTLCLCLAVMTVFTAGLTSCGDSDSSTDDNATSQAQQNVTKDVVSIADKLAADITYKDSLNELESSMYEKIYGITEDMYKSAKVYVGSGGSTAEEIACFEATSSDNATKIKEAMEKRIESQKTAFVDYQPAEMDKLNAPVVVTSGNYVFMCLSDDNDQAKEIIG